MHLKPFLMGGYILSILSFSNLLAVPLHYYRTTHSGSWNDIAIWECSLDENFGDVQPAIDVPDYTCQTIRISTGDTIVISTSVIMDEVIVEQNATLIYGNYVGSTLTIADGAGIDLRVYGTFEDSGPNNLIWLTSQSSWVLGNQATMIRTRSTSATLWRDHYENGMSTIPSTSAWILRKLTADPPSISGVNSWYGNLRIENATTTFWNANLVGSKITGSSSAPVIKGSMEIGISGVSGVKFYSQNSAVNRLKILGDLKIGLNSEFHLEDATTTTGASGIELWGNLVVLGILSYDQTEASDQNRMILFAGQTDQYIAGSGNIFCYNLSNSKSSGDLILLRSIEIHNKLILEEGELDLNSNSLSIQNGAATAVERIDGWIKSETSDFSSVLQWNIGNNPGIHEFPFGKEGDYIPVFILTMVGDPGLVSIATYGTASNNQPLPVLPLVTNLQFHSYEISTHMIDRFWFVQKTGILDGVQGTFTFAPDEKQGSEETLEAVEYNEVLDQWMDPSCCQTQSFVQRRVTVPEIQRNAVWAIIAPDEALYFGMKDNFLLKEAIASHNGKLFPVPCHGEVFFLHELQNENLIRYEIFNALGQKILEGDLSEGVMGLYKIDLTGINEKGTLYLQVKDSFSIKSYKLILE